MRVKHFSNQDSMMITDKLLKNEYTGILDENPVVAIDSKGVVDVAAWRQKASMTEHLVNLTNPMMMKGPFREFFPVGPLKVKVKLPEGKRARRVALLTAGTAPKVEESNGWIGVTAVSVELHEVVAIDLA